mgnify:CR=1 FL=1
MEISAYYLGCTLLGISLVLTVLLGYKFYKAEGIGMMVIPAVLLDIVGIIGLITHNGWITLV